MDKKLVVILKTIIHVTCLALVTNIYYLAVTDQFGGDPVEAVLHYTGKGAFNLLLLSLAVTPLVKTLKWRFLMQVRRLLGLYSFSYALCHLVSFLAFEVQFNWQLFIEEIVTRPYITVGMCAFTILLALAITSISTIRKRMGRNWQKLHNWVYLAVLLVAIHFYWSVKSEIIEPSIYLFIVVILLVLRKDKISRWLLNR